MSLSTSSSRLTLALSIAAVLLLAYNTLVTLAPPPVTEFQNQWVRNFAYAERFIYRREAPEVVIVGSSMAARLKAELVHPDAYNLSFASAGVTTGIDIIERSGLYPRLLLVESNIVEKEADTEMLDSLFTPVLWQLKKVLRFLQYQYQPGNLLMSWVTNRYGRSAGEKLVDKPSEHILQREMQRRLQAYEDDSLIRAADLAALYQSLSRLADKGTTVVFITMPIARELTLSPQYLARAQRLESEFAEFEHLPVEPADSTQYQTNDGVHLGYASALAFSRELAERVKPLLQ